MYEKTVLGLEEAARALEAILNEASREPARPISVAVVDERGDLIHFARMDGARLLTAQLALRKAYTAARMRRNTVEFQELLKAGPMTLADLGDPNITSVQGGVCVLKPGEDTCLGGIGVSGRRAEEDHELAIAGLKAMQL